MRISRLFIKHQSNLSCFVFLQNARSQMFFLSGSGGKKSVQDARKRGKKSGAGILLNPVPLFFKAALTKISLKNLVREEMTLILKESLFMYWFSSPLLIFITITILLYSAPADAIKQNSQSPSSLLCQKTLPFASHTGLSPHPMWHSFLIG